MPYEKQTILTGDLITADWANLVQTQYDEAARLIERNAYDDYSLHMELYYSGNLGGSKPGTTKSLVWDGFMDSDFMASNQATYESSSGLVPCLTTKRNYSVSDGTIGGGNGLYTITNPNTQIGLYVSLGSAGLWSLGAAVTVVGRAQDIVIDVHSSTPEGTLLTSITVHDSTSGFHAIYAPGPVLMPGTAVLVLRVPGADASNYVTVQGAASGGSGDCVTTSDDWTTQTVWSDWRPYMFADARQWQTGDVFATSPVVHLDYTATSVRLYFSCVRGIGYDAKPQVSFDGGVSFVDGTTVGSRADPFFADFAEYAYDFTGSGMDLVFRTVFSSAAIWKSAKVKRYGAHIS